MADRRQVGVVVTDGETMPPVSISHRRNSVTTVAASVGGSGGGSAGASMKGKREPRELAQGSGGSAMSKAASGAGAGARAGAGAGAGSTSTPAKKAPAKDIR